MGARAAARGDPPAQVVAVARSVAPEGARVEVERVGDRVRVTVRAVVHPFAALPAVGALDVSGRGTALAEDATGPGP